MIYNARAVLREGFEGGAVCDGWRSYPAFTGRIQRDWAHLLREADWLAEHFKEAGPMTRALHRLYGDLMAYLNEDVRLLLSLTGVDVYTALLIRPEIGSIDRFPDYKRLISWAGLAPSLHQSRCLTDAEAPGPGLRDATWAGVTLTR